MSQKYSFSRKELIFVMLLQGTSGFCFAGSSLKGSVGLAKDRHTNQWNRTASSEADPGNLGTQYIFTEVSEISGRARLFNNNGNS